MKITLNTGVYWDTETKEQSEEARAWLREHVLSHLGNTSEEGGMLPPELDVYHRPIRWYARFDAFTVIVEREYIEANSYSWAMKKEHVIVTSEIM